VIRLGVLGWPVAHSLSPAMQNAALERAGLGNQWRYQLLPVPPELFDETVVALPAAGFRGVNVTIPHKSAALALSTQASDRAAAIGAANTLLFNDGGQIWADNTDAPALIVALEQRLAVAGCSALVLGAGGSARAVIWALRDAGVDDVRIWNRTHGRAAALSAELGGQVITDIGDARDTDVLINCTSIGLHDGDDLAALSLIPDGLREHRVIVDYVYRQGGTPLTNAAESVGVPHVDGLELLVGQGAIAFELFTDSPAPVDAMRAAVGLETSYPRPREHRTEG
jgi:shikimate dehydrogenase